MARGQYGAAAGEAEVVRRWPNGVPANVLYDRPGYPRGAEFVNASDTGMVIAGLLTLALDRPGAYEAILSDPVLRVWLRALRQQHPW